VSLKERDIIDLAGVKLLVLHTPGHTPGGISLYSKEDGVAFVGDTLFADSIGRTDFPGGSMSQLLNGVREKYLTASEKNSLPSPEKHKSTPATARQQQSPQKKLTIRSSNSPFSVIART